MAGGGNRGFPARWIKLNSSLRSQHPLAGLAEKQQQSVPRALSGITQQSPAHLAPSFPPPPLAPPSTPIFPRALGTPAPGHRVECGLIDCLRGGGLGKWGLCFSLNRRESSAPTSSRQAPPQSAASRGGSTQLARPAQSAARGRALPSCKPSQRTKGAHLFAGGCLGRLRRPPAPPALPCRQRRAFCPVGRGSPPYTPRARSAVGKAAAAAYFFFISISF
jgi:hypothetical protein